MLVTLLVFMSFFFFEKYPEIRLTQLPYHTLCTAERKLALLKVISLPEYSPDDFENYRRLGFRVSTHSHLHRASERQSTWECQGPTNSYVGPYTRSS